MEKNKNKIQFGEVGLLTLLAVLWGSSYFLTKIVVESIPAITLIAVRVSIAAVFLSLVVHLRKEVFPRDKKSWGMLFVQAVFNSIGAWTVLALLAATRFKVLAGRYWLKGPSCKNTWIHGGR